MNRPYSRLPRKFHQSCREQGLTDVTLDRWPKGSKDRVEQAENNCAVAKAKANLAVFKLVNEL